MLQALSKIRRIDTTSLFPNQRGGRVASIKKPWLAAIEAAGIDDFKFHDLRHTAASYLAMSGASLLEIAEILGHKTLPMVRILAKTT